MSKHNWNNTKVLITGANGYIGSLLAKKLVENGAVVCCLVKDSISSLETHGIIDSIQIQKLDINNYYKLQLLMANFRPCTVFHFAAQSKILNDFELILETFNSNVQGTLNVFESARVSNVKNVVFSSSNIIKYYNSELCPQYLNSDYTRETKNSYSMSKIFGEQIAQFYMKKAAFNVVITRCSNVYGPLDIESRLIPKTIIKIMNGNPPTIYGNGKNLINYVFIEDVIEAYLKFGRFFMETGKHDGIFEITSTYSYTVLDVIKAIINIMKKEVEIVFSGYGSFDAENNNITNTKIMLDWEAKTSFEDGLKKTIDSYKSNQNSKLRMKS
jgi:nucleoside-diphosphate-sugar epimerase